MSLFYDLEYDVKMHRGPKARHGGTFPPNMKVCANNVLITFCTVGISFIVKRLYGVTQNLCTNL